MTTVHARTGLGEGSEQPTAPTKEYEGTGKGAIDGCCTTLAHPFTFARFLAKHAHKISSILDWHAHTKSIHREAMVLVLACPNHVSRLLSRPPFLSHL